MTISRCSWAITSSWAVIGPGLAEFRECRPAAQLVVAKVTNASQYGVVTLDAAGKVAGLEEKPAAPRSDLAITGVYFFTPEIHEAVASIRPSWRNEWEITDAVQWLLEHGRTVRAHTFPGNWYDTGTVADLLDCNQVLLETLEPGVYGVVDTLTKVSGPVLIEPGARVERSRIVGPVIVGAGCTVADSYIGPFTSIGRYCRLVHASVESSILLDRVTVSHIRFIQDSLIGHSAEITRCGTTPARRLVVGDDCKMELLA